MNKSTIKVIVAASLVCATFLTSSSAIYAATVKSPTTTACFDCIKNKANDLINQRINSLNQLIDEANNEPLLTQDERDSFKNQINTDINGLNTLKGQINSDTTWAALGTDIRAIFTDFRIYAVFDPQMNLLIDSDQLGAYDASLTLFAQSLQEQINQAAANGQNVQKLQLLLNQVFGNLTAAAVANQNLQINVSFLTPADYPQSSYWLNLGRQDYQEGVADTVKAQKEANLVEQGLQ